MLQVATVTDVEPERWFEVIYFEAVYLCVPLAASVAELLKLAQSTTHTGSLLSTCFSFLLL